MALTELAIGERQFSARPIDESLLLELHRRICGDLVPAIAGRWRSREVQVGDHQPPPAWRVPLLMRDYMKLALQEAVDSGNIRLPLVEVDFSEHDPTGDVEADLHAGRLIDAVGKITSLQVPHRLADAILRDSELDGVPFRQSETGKALNTVSLANATPVFEPCPTALLFGMWDSTGPKGALVR